MFGLFKNRNSIKSPKRLSSNESRLDNPSFLFSQCGQTLNDLWQELIKGENAAVLQYKSYDAFLSANLSKSLIDLLKTPMLSVFNESGNKSISLTRGQIAYLVIFDFKNDIFVSDQDESDIYLLKQDQLLKAKDELSFDEIAFSNKVADYFRVNIIPMVNAVARRRWGIDICEYSLPLNTIKCVKYHMYICNEQYDFDGGSLSKWNYIFSAPMYEYRSGRDNPVVPVQINNMSAYILDCLCYSNIALPTLDIVRLLNYRDENTNIKESLENRFGPGVVTFMKKCIVDYNCANFRKWVSLGMMTR